MRLHHRRIDSTANSPVDGAGHLEFDRWPNIAEFDTLVNIQATAHPDLPRSADNQLDAVLDHLPLKTPHTPGMNLAAVPPVHDD